MKIKYYIAFILIPILSFSQSKKTNYINSLILNDKLSVLNLLVFQDENQSIIIKEQEIYFEFEAKKLREPSLLQYNCIDDQGKLIFIGKYSTEDYPTNKLITTYFDLNSQKTNFLSRSEIDTLKNHSDEYLGESKYNKIKTNGNSQIERIRNFSFDGEIFDERLFEYDKNGRVVKCVWKRKCNFQSGTCEDQVITFFKYDAKNNLIKSYLFGNVTRNDKLIQNNFIYYNEQNQISKITETTVYMGDEGHNSQILKGKLKGEFKFYDRDIINEFKYSKTNNSLEIKIVNSNKQYSVTVEENFSNFKSYLVKTN
ncbi:hypothetical protein [Flavobacterium sp.]|uniref:hypothetical protein n=1 Tax=Flavobacterium sp. TaxID=239 RepID=UPI0039E4E4F4